jgi:hydrogenase nickel incorporation protein HypA/HybF
VHELSIAESVVRIAVENAAGRRVARVEVRAGALRQVVPSALDFAFELVARGTVAEGAELVIEEVAAEGICRRCGAHTVLEDFPLICGRCGALDLEVVAGEELVVDSLDLEETLTTTGGDGYGN